MCSQRRRKKTSRKKFDREEVASGTVMAPKRSRKSSDDNQPIAKRIPPTFTPEEKAKRAQERAILEQELRERCPKYQDPNIILVQQPMRKRAEQSASQTPAASVQPVESWCQCGNCINLPTEEECVCCKVIRNVLNKMEEDEPISCITEHHTFIGTCLNKEQLTLCESYRCFGPTRQAPLNNRSLRMVAYRMFTVWVHGYLGRKNRRTIPACAVQKVRAMFPEENQVYVGFKLATDNNASEMADF
ncbi:uncharacterized protein LOC142741743 [Rhinoderma darwinii]|uniref:uncharacterized protein LOC142741743 n=1 Tax=Rhinoderma darwinii TaxID=43563 RepID=UPI003F675A65